MLAIDLSNQQALDSDPRAIQQIILQQIQIEMKIQEYISFLKKQKKQVWTFQKGV